MFVTESEIKKNLINEVDGAIKEIDCIGCGVTFNWDPTFQSILHVEVTCPTFQDVNICDRRIKVKLIEECEKRNIPHTIGDHTTFNGKEKLNSRSNLHFSKE